MIVVDLGSKWIRTERYWEPWQQLVQDLSARLAVYIYTANSTVIPVRNFSLTYALHSNSTVVPEITNLPSIACSKYSASL